MQLQTIQKTMSSVEIAELTGKRHDHIMRDIESQLTQLNLDLPTFGGIYLDNYKREQRCFNLPKRETLILISGYSVELRAKIIDRWEELENHKPKSLEEISLLAITGLTAKIEEQKKALLEAQPKIEFFDVVADSKGDRTIMEAAKLLKIPKPKSLYKTLRLRGVLSNDNIPYQRYILDGFFRVNLTEKNGRTYSTAYVTNKGLNWLQKKFAGAK